MSDQALVLIDFINEIVHPDGKLSKKGYADFIARHDTIKAVTAALDKARTEHWLVCHVRVGFMPDYSDCPVESPLFSAAKQYHALCRGTWGTEFNDIALPKDSEPTFWKNRVSAFFQTGLDEVLTDLGICHLYLAGVATDLAVEAAARDAHDRDYIVHVLSDACAAASDDDHRHALATMAKIAQVFVKG